MSSIRDAFTLRDKTVEIGGTSFTLRRPSVIDFLESMQVAKETPTRLYPHLVYMHLVDGGSRVFSSADEVMLGDGVLVNRIAKEIELLYEEGRD